MSGSNPERAPVRQPGAAASAAFLVCLGLCAYTLLSVRMPIGSEIRYMESAREMVESGDWIVPKLGYVPYFEKPILLYWLGAGSQLLLGPSLVAMRLPSILAATLCLLVTWDAGRRLLGERGGMQAALVLLGSGYFLVLGSTLTTDTLLAACLWSAWYAWWRARSGGGRHWVWLYAIATALGFMTKGPLAWILVGGSIAAFEILREPQPEGARLAGLALRIWRGALRSIGSGHALLLVVVTVLLNLPWTLAVLRRDPRFLEFFYVRENFKAFFDGNVHHSQGPFYYVGVLLMAYAPWSILCGLGICVVIKERCLEAWRARAPVPPAGGPAELRVYLGAIVLFTLLFLQSSSAKLASYPLPILPALAILLVDLWHARLARPPAWMRWSLLAGSVLVIAGVTYTILGREDIVQSLAPALRAQLVIAFATTGFALVAGGLLTSRGRFWAGIATSGVALALLLVVVTPRMEEMNLGRDVAPLARQIAQRAQPGDLVVTTSQFVQDYTLQLTLHQRIGLVGSARELGMGFFTEVTKPDEPVPEKPYSVSAGNLPSNPWLYTREALVQALCSRKRVWFVGSRKEVDELQAELPNLSVLDTVGDARLATNVN